MVPKLLILCLLAFRVKSETCLSDGPRFLQQAQSIHKVLSADSHTSTHEIGNVSAEHGPLAQFLIQATFGPTRASIASLASSTYLDWIDEQMQLPVESHREYFRERVNPRARGDLLDLHSGHPRPRCKVGSRWVSYSFLSSDEGKSVQVKNQSIFVAGELRSDVDPLFLGNSLAAPQSCTDRAPDDWVEDDTTCAMHAHKMSWNCRSSESWAAGTLCQQTCFSEGHGYESDDCSVGWPALEDYTGFVCEVGQEAAGSWVLLSTTHFCNQSFTAMLNPRVWRKESDLSMGQNLSFDIFRPGVLLLGHAQSVDCDLSSFIQSNVEAVGRFYRLEDRIEIVDNSLEAPATSENWVNAECPHVARTFINEKHCQVRRGCRATEVDGTDAQEACCAAYSLWPDVDGGVTCGSTCRALVYTAPFGNRCDTYCASFGHICVSAAEEVNENCEVKGSSVPCDVPINDTSDMLCTCQFAAASETCVADSMNNQLFEVCGSPGETSNNPKLGHQLGFEYGDDLDDKHFDMDYEYTSDLQRLSKTSVWTMKALYAKDQLRQRVSWALSQIFVAAVNGPGFSDRPEMWLNYYDIFIRNAFGNFRDVLREVTYSPVMGEYLSYRDNRAFDSSGRFPDENYAREIMQLFTIGLWKLNESDGSKILDESGAGVPTYTNEHIMSFARVFTGFREQGKRANLEETDNHNYIDPMRMQASWHDAYPKQDLDGGYLGDKYPLCSDFPQGSFLRQGARFSFLGPDYFGTDVLALDAASALYQTLCHASGDASAGCTYSAMVELPESLVCHGFECEAAHVHVLKVGQAFYEYIPTGCVELFFFNGRTTVLGGSRRRSSSHKCQNPKYPVAGTACCAGCTNKTTSGMKDKNRTCENAHETYPQMFTRYCNFSSTWASKKYCQLACWEHNVGYDGDDCSFGPWQGQRVCAYPKATMRLAQAEEECAARGLQICDEPLDDNFGCEHDGMRVWTPDACSDNVVVHPDGQVSSGTKLSIFPVRWAGAGVHPSVQNGTCPTGCTVADSADCLSCACSCSMRVEERQVFNLVPTKAELQAKLHIGFTSPATECTMNCDGEVRVFAIDAIIDASTVFECQGHYYSNKEVIVTLGEFSFRNPPVFLQRESPESHAALDEVEALLDHLFHHPNTQFFFSYRLIQRMVTSNPTPNYLKAVAEAFKSGAFHHGGNVLGSGRYGDLQAAVAAVLLHPEARNPKLASDGALREPLLKLLSFLRAMEYQDKAGRNVVMKNLIDRIGEWPFESPSVFNFYQPDHGPESFPNHTVAPEFEIFTPPMAMHFINGMLSLVDHGLGKCDKGFGWDGRGCSNGNLKLGELECVGPTIDQLDLLLTGGRLGATSSKDIVRAAFDEVEGGEKFKAAQKAIIMTPEFHTMGKLAQAGQRPEDMDLHVAAPRSYKAMVLVFLGGGADTFNILVPWPSTACTLYEEYIKVRQTVALAEDHMHQISATGQACAQFGIHSQLSVVKNLYDQGQAAFFSDVGSLVNPLDTTKFQGAGARCAGLFSHSDQQRAAQTLTCQHSSATSKGAGGRIADALAAQGFRTNSFSMAGSKTWPQGFQTKAGIVDKDEGAVRLEQYASLKAVVDNITSMTYTNIYGDEYVGQLAKAIQFNEELYQQLASVELKTAYKTPNSLSDQLKQVARLMVAHAERKAERDFFFVSLGGFDTHTDVISRLDDKLAELDVALQGFVEELKAQNLFESSVILTHSDFGRTLSPNSNHGTDHAWSGNHILLGGAIKGGDIFNQFPHSLTAGSAQDAGRGRLIPAYPWESMIVPVAEWMGLQPSQEAEVFPNLVNFNRSTHIVSKDALFHAAIYE